MGFLNQIPVGHSRRPFGRAVESIAVLKRRMLLSARGDTASELMDMPCGYEEFRDCLSHIDIVNRSTLGHRPTLLWLNQFRDCRETLHIVDVGCGGGHMLREIEGWAYRLGLSVKLTGIDINPHAVRASQDFSGGSSSIVWKTGDVLSLRPEETFDIVISSLMTHHLLDDEIVRFLGWMERCSRRAWFINDLHRHPGAYYLMKALAGILPLHPFVKHDGPVSILRAFKIDEWRALVSAANLHQNQIDIRHHMPGRLCLSRIKK